MINPNAKAGDKYRITTDAWETGEAFERPGAICIFKEFESSGRTFSGPEWATFDMSNGVEGILKESEVEPVEAENLYRTAMIEDMIESCTECNRQGFFKKADCDGCIAAVDDRIAAMMGNQMKLEVGKQYVTRDGRVTGPLGHTINLEYPFESQVPDAGYQIWRSDGTWASDVGKSHHLDLVAEHIPEVTEAEVLRDELAERLRYWVGKHYNRETNRLLQQMLGDVLGETISVDVTFKKK